MNGSLTGGQCKASIPRGSKGFLHTSKCPNHILYTCRKESTKTSSITNNTTEQSEVNHITSPNTTPQVQIIPNDWSNHPSRKGRHF